MPDVFENRVKNFPGDDLMSFNLAAVAEALDTIQRLSDENVGGEVVKSRLGEYKSWDPDVFKVDKDAEDGYISRIKEKGWPAVLLSEEAERIELNTEGKTAETFVVSDPFDGSYLFKRGIPDFWYSSLAFFNTDGSPRCCAVGDGVHKVIAYANAEGAFIGKLEGDTLANQFRLDKAYREAAGRKDVTDLATASIESYAMKPKKFLLPLVDTWRTVMEPFKFYLPNGGPYGFVDVAEGKIDCYFAPRQPFVDIFSGIYVAQQAETVVTDFDGNPVTFEDNVHGLYDVVASTNKELHDQVLALIAKCK
jgi:fructose-1,6-bisphosphatase/inositol monophosphatase family enzyme